jgi:hypothetical protein
VNASDARVHNRAIGLSALVADSVTIVMQGSESKRFFPLSTRSVDKSVHGAIRALRSRQKMRIGSTLVKKVPTLQTPRKSGTWAWNEVVTWTRTRPAASHVTALLSLCTTVFDQSRAGLGGAAEVVFVKPGFMSESSAKRDGVWLSSGTMSTHAA